MVIFLMSTPSELTPRVSLNETPFPLRRAECSIAPQLVSTDWPMHVELTPRIGPPVSHRLGRAAYGRGRALSRRQRIHDLYARPLRGPRRDGRDDGGSLPVYRQNPPNLGCDEYGPRHRCGDDGQPPWHQPAWCRLPGNTVLR